MYRFQLLGLSEGRIGGGLLFYSIYCKFPCNWNKEHLVDFLFIYAREKQIEFTNVLKRLTVIVKMFELENTFYMKIVSYVTSKKLIFFLLL